MSRQQIDLWVIIRSVDEIETTGVNEITSGENTDYESKSEVPIYEPCSVPHGGLQSEEGSSKEICNLINE